MRDEGAARRLPVPPVRLLRSLRARAFLAVAVVLALPLVFVYGSALLEGGVGERMLATVGTAAEEAASAWRSGTPEAIDGIAQRHAVRIRVASPTGTPVVDRDHERSEGLARELGRIFFGDDGAPSLAELDEELGPLASRAEVGRARRLGSEAGCRPSDGRKLLVCHAVVVLPSDGTVVYVQESSRRTIRALYDSSYQLKKLMVVVAPIAVALGWWLGWGMVRPIERLREEALAQATRAAPGTSLPRHREDEVGDLTEALNVLLASLEERSAATQAFMSDLVHELKSPVATVRACAEALQDGAPDPERAARLARALAASSERLDAVVSELLELARAEAGLPDEHRERVDLAELVRGIVAHRATVDGPAIDVDASEPVCVDGVRTRLEAAVRNLVENAVSFTPADGTVRVTATLAERGVTVEVADSGPGIPAEHLPRVFDRFFTSRGERKGTGLGLALVRAVAEAHGGRAEVGNRPEGGAAFRIVLPRA